MPIIVDPYDTTLTSVLNRDVMLYVPGAPIFEVEYRLKQAVRDFCRITQVWQQRNTEILTTVADQEEYDAGLPSGTELVAVISAYLADGTEVDIEVPGEAEDQMPSESDSVWKIGLAGTEAVRLTPLPSTSGVVVTGTVAFAPNEESEDLPTVIYNRWRTPIAHGAIAAMMTQVGKTWSNPTQALYHQGRFDDGARECSVKTGPIRRRPLRVRTY
jgi:hypothetical protein